MKRLLLLSLLLSWVSAPDGLAQGRTGSEGRPRLVPLSDQERCALGNVDACNRARRHRSYGSLETSVEAWRNTPDGRATCFLASGLCDKAEEVASGMDSVARWATDAWDGVAGAVDGAMDGAAGAVDSAAEWARDALDGTPDASGEAGSAWPGSPAASPGSVEVESNSDHRFEWSPDPDYEWPIPDPDGSAISERPPAYYGSGHDGLPAYQDPGYEWSIPDPGGSPVSEGAPVDYHSGHDGLPAYQDPGYEWSIPDPGASAVTEGAPSYYGRPSPDSFGSSAEWMPPEAGGAPAYQDPGAWQRPTPSLLTSDEIDAMRARILNDIADERSRSEAEMAAIRERQGGFGKALGGFFKGLGSVGGELLKNGDVIANTFLNNGNGFPPLGNGLASTTLDSFPTTFDCNWLFRMAGQAWHDSGMSMSDCQGVRSDLINEGLLGSDGSFLSLEQLEQKIHRDLPSLRGNGSFRERETHRDLPSLRGR